MMALAIASGNPLLGATILFAFVLGTSPVFFILGYFASRLGEKMHDRFMKGAAIALILLALFTFRGAFALAGVGNTNEPEKKAETQIVTSENPTIEFTSSSYQPRSINVKAGSHVTLNLVNKNGAGCIQAFTIPKLGIQKIVRVGQTDTVEFDAPKEKGKISFMCSMGMYQGVINVI
jgi:heme/copper-type cytochrome/quinol oxidase subunit 2